MKTTTVRKMDNMNRVVLPADMRAALGIGPKSYVSLEQDKEGVITIEKGEKGSERMVDELGRIALSAEMREAMNLNSDAEVWMSCDGDRILLQAPVPVCRLCGCEIKGNHLSFGGSLICMDCLNLIKESKIICASESVCVK